MRPLFPATPPREQGGVDDPSRDIRRGAIMGALFFLGFGGWAAFAPLDAGVVAPGVVVVSGYRQAVQHRDGGTVSALHVKEGDRVTRSEVLLEFAATEIQAQERALFGQFVELDATRARLLAESAEQRTIPVPASWAAFPAPDRALAETILARQQREMNTRRSSLGAQVGVLGQRREQLTSRIVGYGNQIAALDRQSALIADELAGLKTLAEKGLVPMPRIRALERQQAEIDGRRAELVASIAQTREAMGETRLQSLSIVGEKAEDRAASLREVEMRLADVSPRLGASRAQLERTRVRAPASGLVVGLTANTVGGVVAPGARIMDVVPENQPLVIEARVRPEDADDLKVGMRTEIRFSGLSGRATPILHGVVTRMSADRFTDERSGVAYFLAEAEAPRAEIERVAQVNGDVAIVLKAGMPAEMVVPLRKRTALQYLLEPLDQAIWRSFRQH
ncbi:MAG: HlyD family secretion protein [Alphaproteobacteria bacterium]|nr:MAG: HlyD family secretion protein [Caulobacteraceae bacterium]TPW07909.1 MAG: HlyD family secretion protein [Alphaproteobacteria bacterium]